MMLLVKLNNIKKGFQMANETLLINQAIHILDCQNVDNTKEETQIDVMPQADIVATALNINEEGKEKIVNLLKRLTKVKSTKSSIISIEDESDVLMLQSIILKLKIEVSKDIADFENNKFDIVKLKKVIKDYKKAIPKKVSPFKSAREELIAENKEVTAKSLSDKTKLPIKDAESYMKRLEVVAKAQAGRTKNK